MPLHSKVLCGLFSAALAVSAAPISHAEENPPLDLRYSRFEPRPPYSSKLKSESVLRDAKITASGFWDRMRPELALDGKRDNPEEHWACEQLPATLTLELSAVREVAQLNLWLYWPGQRIYKYFVEGSEDGKTWRTLADRRNNTVPASSAGFSFVLPQPARIKWLRTTITDSSQRQAGGHIVEIEAYEKPLIQELGGATGTIHRRIDGDNLPLDSKTRSWQATAWRGERVHGSFAVWSGIRRDQLRTQLSPLTGPAGTLPAGAAKVRFVRHVMADKQYVGDVLDEAASVDMEAGSYRPLWLSVSVPPNAAPGRYRGTLTVRAANTPPVTFDLNLEVLPAKLPPPAQWKFHLDLWQHPWAIARYHGVQPWSEAHWSLMRPILTELANAGQKIVTTTVTHLPWNHQNFDAYHSMVTRTRQPDGSWKFDYSIFDRYIEFAQSCGIRQQINCYTLIPWHNTYYYTDARSGDFVSFTAQPGSKEYEEFWGPFLKNFQAHLKAKGWLSKTMMAMDERPPVPMRAAIALVKKYAPQLRVSLAANEAPSHFSDLELDEFSIILNQADPDLLRDIAQRRKENKITTFYVCVGPPRPNTFVTSPAAESVWLGYYAASNGFDGFLRWAYTNWPRDPLYDTSFGSWPAGDTHLIYPGPRSSIRWELLRDGIEESEKLRVLRQQAPLSPTVITALEQFKNPQKLGDENSIIAQVEAARHAVQEASRTLR
ncbi:MAG: hypothetical protein JWN98_2640 [Abditibacteriota bacterium]|nr:hypothetical protein [Abditibacteriota bacterium]